MADIFENNDLSGLFSDVFGEGVKTWISLSDYSRTGMTTFTRYCQKCGAKLRLPQNMGKIDVRCPKCGFVFSIDTGEDPARARQTPPAASQPAPAAAERYERNELDDYRPGGSRWTDMLDQNNPTTVRHEEIAQAIARDIQDYLTRGYSKWTNFAEDTHWGIVRDLSLNLDLMNAYYDYWSPDGDRKWGHCVAPSYNELAGRTDERTFMCSDKEREEIRARALSILTTLMPNAVMRDGLINNG